MIRKFLLSLTLIWFPLQIAIIYLRCMTNEIEIIHKNSKEMVFKINAYPAAFLEKSDSVFVENRKTYILADSSNVCETLKQPPRIDILNTQESSSRNLTESNEGRQVRWIILSPLIPGCDFEKLIKNAKKSGYEYNSLFLYGDFIFNAKNVTIPSEIPTFFVSDKDGDQLLQNYSHPKSYFVHIVEPFDWHLWLTGPYHTMKSKIVEVSNDWTATSVVTTTLLIIVFGLLAYKVVGVNNRRYIQIYQPTMFLRNPNVIMFDRMLMGERGIHIRQLAMLILAARRGHQSYSEIQLPSMEWKAEGEETEQCSICLDDYKTGQELKSLPCKHNFHSSCIRTWLTSSNICPLCRHPVRSEQQSQTLDQIIQEISDSIQDSYHS